MKKLFYILLMALAVSVYQPAFTQVNGQMPLNPKSIPQFVDPLPHFAGMRVDASGGELVITYEATSQVAVSTGTVLDNGVVGTDPGAGLGPYWGYSVSNGDITTPPFWPAYTIEARRGIPVHVHYKNNLHGQTYADVNLVVDQTLHWADPLNHHEMDHAPFTPYMGPVPVVPHLHGGEVASESDGGPEAWFTPDLEHLGYAWTEQGGADDHYHYPNSQEEATLWFHDHSLGVTRLNVYAGLAGFYFLRGHQEEAARLPGWSGDDMVQEVAPPGTSGTFQPDPYLPEVEIVFQDRMFDTNGELYFPNLPSVPEHPYWTPEFIGDVITVNGKTWPYLSVAPRKYRFRLLNGSNARFYEMWLTDVNKGMNGPSIVQIGTDGGLMDKPADISINPGSKLVLAPGERADVVVDFSASAPNQVWILRNIARTPYPKGTPPNPETTGRLMQFVVNGKMVSAGDPSKPGTDKSWLPASLRQTPMVKLTDFAGGINAGIHKKRQLTLNEVMSMEAPKEALINNTKWDGDGMENEGLGVTEFPVEGETELWQIMNLTGDAHPIHLHLVQMQLVSRQRYNVSKYMKAYDMAFDDKEFEPAEGPPYEYHQENEDEALGGNPAFSSFLQGPVMPPLPNERGWKDTYIMYPGEVTTFIVRFAPTDIPVDADPSELMFDFNPGAGLGYVWHCHILDHEDNEMMRPYKVMASSYRTDDELTAQNLKSGITGADDLSVISSEFSLDQNYPNPFTGDTEIRFYVPERMHTELSLINQNGQTIRVLHQQMTPRGNHTVRLHSAGLGKGIYFYRLTAGSQVKTKRLVIN